MVTKARSDKAVMRNGLITDTERFDWIKRNHQAYITLFGSFPVDEVDQQIDKKIAEEIRIANQTKAEAEQIVKDKLKEVEAIYAELSQIAVRHQIYVYATGPAGYGSGAHVALEDRATSWDSQSEGEWVSSSRNC
jgi:hypothetical protein